MTLYPRVHAARAPFGLALAAGLLLAGCGGSGPKVETGLPPAPKEAEGGWSARTAVGDAIELLNKGQPVPARAKLIDVLKKQNDPIARGLIKQIDEDPVALLGKQSFAYTAKEGDTFSTLAAKYLGDPTKFYALARYNKLTASGTLEPGTALRIPGKEPPKPKPAAPKPEAPAKKPVAEAPAAPPPPPAAPPPPPAPAKKPTANPAQVQQLRAQALEQMNRGAIDRAVALLQRALALDPGNVLVKRDLDRALRIRGAVRK